MKSPNSDGRVKFPLFNEIFIKSSVLIVAEVRLKSYTLEVELGPSSVLYKIDAFSIVIS